MPDATQRAVIHKRKADERYLAASRNPHALLEGWKCPVCKNEFRDEDACSHTWNDVRKSNDRFVLDYVKGLAR